MSFFFGTDLWDEMNRMQRQLEDLACEVDYKRPRIEGSKKPKKEQALSPFSGDLCSFNPVTDLAENDDSYVVSMDLPGVKKDELDVTVHNGVLTVSGTRRHKFATHEDDDDEKEKKEEKPEEKATEAAASSEKKEGDKKDEKKEEKKDKKPKHKVIRMESYCGSFKRSIAVPAGTTSDDVTAKFEDGVLTVTIAKHKKDPVKKIQIQ